jgi:NADPH:quinone reductase-like Zn-dependent oxidoreductase
MDDHHHSWNLVSGVLVANEKIGGTQNSRKKVRPVIDRTYPLSEIPEAFRYLEEEHARGKVSIVM